MRENSSIHLSITLLEAIAKKELDPDRHPDIKLHIDQCETCAAYLNKLKTGQGLSPSLVSQPSSSESGKRGPAIYREEEFPERRSKAGTLLLLGLIILVVGGAILFFHPPFLDDTLPVQDDSVFNIRINGDTLPEDPTGVTCTNGDLVEFFTERSRPFYFLVLSQDDGGAIKNCLPGTSDTAELAESDGSELLPDRLVLQGDWTRKTLFCILKDEKFSFLEALTIVNRYLRKELPSDRPQIEVYYLTRSNSPSGKH